MNSIRRWDEWCGAEGEEGQMATLMWQVRTCGGSFQKRCGKYAHVAGHSKKKRSIRVGTDER